MNIYLKEKIGNPDLFTGRKKELSSLLKWVEKIKPELSMSMAILSRRKTGKTALLQRLYNIVFHNNNGVIPFYYEVREKNQWILDFCQDFFLTFIYQYIAFKSRNTAYLVDVPTLKTFKKAIEIARKEHCEYLIEQIEAVQMMAQEEREGLMWEAVRDAPRGLAALYDERVVQIIDEFQYLNRRIYRDRALTNLVGDMAASYLHTAEYKNAPLLVAGSWVGWLMDDLIKQLPGRFLTRPLKNLPEDETIEMICKYALLERVPVTEETTCLIAKLSEGNPFYVSALFRSDCPEKDLTTQEGLLKTLEFETYEGSIKGTWMEYVQSALPRVNDRYARHIVLYLSQHRDREVSRKELQEKLNLTMTENELEKKLKALVNSNIIEQGRSNFYYQGVQDNIFDKVFRGEYADEIEAFNPQEITNDYKALFEKWHREYQRLSGEYNRYKGLFAEFLIINQLRYRAYKDNDRFLSMNKNLPDDFQFTEYESVWSYKAALADRRDLNIDVFARAKEGEYSLICEVKNRATKAFSADEAAEFLQKVQRLQELEQVEKAVPFVFSRKGFTNEALVHFREHHIAWSDDARWLEQND